MVAPTISINPASTTVGSGGTATLSVTASGGALNYQWAFNGTNILNATNATLTVTNFCLANVGSYVVTVSNSMGRATSTPAMLTGLDVKLFFGLIVNGPLGSNYIIQATSNLSSNWAIMTNIALPSQPYIYIDYSSLTNSQQFYRVLPQ